MMKKGSTWFLRGTVLLLGLMVLALCIFALPSAWEGGQVEFPTARTAVICIVIILYATVIPFFIALGETLKLLSYIDKNIAFGDLSVKALRKIKYCAIVIAVFYFINVPLLLPIAQADDAPGLLIVGFVIACAPVVVAVFAAVLERLLKDAIKIQAENELTV